MKYASQLSSKAIDNVIPKINNKISFIFFMILLSTPFIWIVWHQQDYGLILETSQDILKIMITSTLGMLGLVITSATFMANYYKDVGEKRLKILIDWNSLQEELLKQKALKKLSNLTINIIIPMINNMLESYEARYNFRIFEKPLLIATTICLFSSFSSYVNLYSK